MRSVLSFIRLNTKQRKSNTFENLDVVSCSNDVTTKTSNECHIHSCAKPFKSSRRVVHLYKMVCSVVSYESLFENEIEEIPEEIEDYFVGIMKKDQNVSAGMAAIQTLMKVLEDYKSETVQELDSNLRFATDVIRNTDYPVTAVVSGSELFLRFITLTKLDTNTFEECKAIMLRRGQLFLKKLIEARGKVAQLGSKFIIDGCRILTHSKSRVVLQTMKLAAQKNKRFEVFITESSPDDSGIEMAKELEKANIPCTIILDSAIGYIMEYIDLVMVGAEGVVESGGIINKVGSYTLAVCAKEMKKPFYVLTESFKFVRIYPLSQQDVPDEFKYTGCKRTEDVSKEHPLVDYTPPKYINLLFTDLGILTPSAVSDELIKLYL